MKIFLTGGTGYIGSHLIEALTSAGHELTLLTRNPGGLRPRPAISVIEGSMEDHGAIHAGLQRQEACIHNAVIWDEEPTELELKDVRASVRLFETASEAGLQQLIYTSSTAVHRPFLPRMDEDGRIEPADFYGATKAATEVFLSAFSHQTSMRCNVIRPGPVVGKPAQVGAPFKSFRRIEEIVRAAMNGEEIQVEKSDGRQFIAASDLASLYVKVLESGRNRQTYLAVARNLTTWESIAREAISLTGSQSNVLVKETKQVPHRFDATKIEREFGLAFDSQSAMTDHLKHLMAS